MHKVEDLKIWQKSIELVKEIYLILPSFPKEEKYALCDQIRRSAVSIPSNIAEGTGRNSQKEFLHFLSIANGSSYELQTQLILSTELNLLTKEKVQPIINILIEIQKMNFVLQNKIKQMM